MSVRDLWILVLLAGGCGDAGGERGTAIPIGVSVVPQAWLVEQVGGERVGVFELVEAGESPATYQPTDEQVTRLMRAAVFFRIGVPFESSPWFDAVASSGTVRIVDLRHGVELPASQSAPPAPASQSAPPARRIEASHGAENPHIWLSPRLLAVLASTVAETLAEIDPGHASEYRTNLAALESRLSALDRDLRQILKPVAGKPFLVFHPAWGYFADAYGLLEVAIEIDGKEPTDRGLTELQIKAREAGVRVVFVQPQISGRTAEAVARAIGGRLETLDPLAHDVAANLRRVAEALRDSYE